MIWANSTSIGLLGLWNEARGVTRQMAMLEEEASVVIK